MIKTTNLTPFMVHGGEVFEDMMIKASMQMSLYVQTTPSSR
jgi:hypothetical protein